MGVIDIILLICIAAALVLAVRRCIKAHRSGKCCGCSGCSAGISHCKMNSKR